VLDRDDARVGGPIGDRLEDLPEAADPASLRFAEKRDRGVLGECAGFAGIGDASGRRPIQRSNQAVVSWFASSGSSSARRPCAAAWTSYERSRGWPVRTPASARSTAR